MYDVLVIGNGLIGSAAAKYLSGTDLKVAIAGPLEPTDWASHSGVFASHYDEGRITRMLDPDPLWAELGRRAIHAYLEIERESGLQFFHPGGCLKVAPDTPQFAELHASLEAVRDRLNLTTCEPLRSAELQERFPYFALSGHTGMLESGTAGHISPRALVQAQTRIAQKRGATLVPSHVERLEVNSESVTAWCASGAQIQAERVLVSSGAFTNGVLPTPLDFELQLRIVLFAELDEAEATRLQDMPDLILEFADHPTLRDVYVLPPIRYPDGTHLLKIGGEPLSPRVPSTQDELKAWFRTGECPDEVEPLKDTLLALIPDLRTTTFHTKPCVLTYTPTNRPYLDTVVPKRLFVAAGGCGLSAKSSDAIGNLAAQLTHHGGWEVPEGSLLRLEAFRIPQVSETRAA